VNEEVLAPLRAVAPKERKEEKKKGVNVLLSTLTLGGDKSD